ncbi:hypothetical protein LEMLEM_LOCUS6520 [Lemmus lemmus]
MGTETQGTGRGEGLKKTRHHLGSQVCAGAAPASPTRGPFRAQAGSPPLPRWLEPSVAAQVSVATCECRRWQQALGVHVQPRQCVSVCLGEWRVRRAPRSLRTVWRLATLGVCHWLLPLFDPALQRLRWRLRKASFREDKGGTPEERSCENYGGRGLSLRRCGGTRGKPSSKIFETVPKGKKVLIFLGGPDGSRIFLPGDALSPR